MKKIFEKLETIYRNDFKFRSLFSKASLNNYTLMYNAIQEPDRDYSYAKMPQIVIGTVMDFLKAPERWFLLEAAPRSGKTTIITNILIPYLLGSMRQIKILVVCGEEKLLKEVMNNIRYNTSCSRGEKDLFFDNIFGSKVVTVNNERNLSFKFIGEKKECTVYSATSLSTPPKGTGYHFIFFIDYMASEHRDREAMQRAYLANFNGYMTRKEYDIRTKYIIDNQRLSVKDLSAHITSRYDATSEKYFRLIMPYYFEETTEYVADGNTFTYNKGDFLVSRYDEEDMRNIIASSGKTVFLTEYQQRPEAIKGEIFSRESFNFYEQLPPLNRVFAVVDTAFEDNKRSDYNVYTVWGYDNKNLYLLDFFRKRLSGLDNNIYLYHFWKKWSVEDPKLTAFSPKIKNIIIEENTHTKELITRLKTGFLISKDEVVKMHNIKTIIRQGKSKFYRVKLAEPSIATGMIFLKKGGFYPSSNSYDLPVNCTNFNDVILNELESYRYDGTHTHDDITDCVSDAINIVTRRYPEFNLQVH